METNHARSGAAAPWYLEAAPRVGYASARRGSALSLEALSTSTAASRIPPPAARSVTGHEASVHASSTRAAQQLGSGFAPRPAAAFSAARGGVFPVDAPAPPVARQLPFSPSPAALPVQGRTATGGTTPIDGALQSYRSRLPLSVDVSLPAAVAPHGGGGDEWKRRYADLLCNTSAKVKELSASLDASLSLNEEMQAELDRVQKSEATAVQRAVRSEAEAQRLTERVRVLTDSVHALEAEVTSLRESRRQDAGAIAAASNAAAAMADLQVQLTAASATTERSVERAVLAEEQCAKLQAEVAERTADMQNVRAQLAQLEQAVKSADAARLAVLASAQGDGAHLRMLLDEANLRADTLAAQLHAAQRSAADAEHENSTTQQRITSLTSALARAEASAATQSQRACEAEEAAASARAALTSLTDALQSARREAALVAAQQAQQLRNVKREVEEEAAALFRTQLASVEERAREASARALAAEQRAWSAEQAARAQVTATAAASAAAGVAGRRDVLTSLQQQVRAQAAAWSSVRSAVVCQLRDFAQDLSVCTSRTTSLCHAHGADAQRRMAAQAALAVQAAEQAQQEARRAADQAESALAMRVQTALEAAAEAHTARMQAALSQAASEHNARLQLVQQELGASRATVRTHEAEVAQHEALTLRCATALHGLAMSAHGLLSTRGLGVNEAVINSVVGVRNDAACLRTNAARAADGSARVAQLLTQLTAYTAQLASALDAAVVSACSAPSPDGVDAEVQTDAVQPVAEEEGEEEDGVALLAGGGARGALMAALATERNDMSTSPIPAAQESSSAVGAGEVQMLLDALAAQQERHERELMELQEQQVADLEAVSAQHDAQVAQAHATTATVGTLVLPLAGSVQQLRTCLQQLRAEQEVLHTETCADLAWAQEEMAHALAIMGEMAWQACAATAERDAAAAVASIREQWDAQSARHAATVQRLQAQLRRALSSIPSPASSADSPVSVHRSGFGAVPDVRTPAANAEPDAHAAVVVTPPANALTTAARRAPSYAGSAHRSPWPRTAGKASAASDFTPSPASSIASSATFQHLRVLGDVTPLFEVSESSDDTSTSDDDAPAGRHARGRTAVVEAHSEPASMDAAEEGALEEGAGSALMELAYGGGGDAASGSMSSAAPERAAARDNHQNGSTGAHHAGGVDSHASDDTEGEEERLVGRFAQRLARMGGGGGGGDFALAHAAASVAPPAHPGGEPENEGERDAESIGGTRAGGGRASGGTPMKEEDASSAPGASPGLRQLMESADSAVAAARRSLHMRRAAQLRKQLRRRAHDEEEEVDEGSAS